MKNNSVIRYNKQGIRILDPIKRQKRKIVELPVQCISNCAKTVLVPEIRANVCVECGNEKSIDWT